jgi:hypothetical protein
LVALPAKWTSFPPERKPDFGFPNKIRNSRGVRQIAGGKIEAAEGLFVRFPEQIRLCGTIPSDYDGWDAN